MKPIFEIKNLSTGYQANETVLTDVSLALNEGEICAVLGEEGAGKTTILKAIIGKLPYTGQVLWKGEDIRNIPTHQMLKKGIDYNLTGENILKNFTVKEHIDLAIQDLPKAERQKKWQDLQAEFPRLTDLQNRKGGQLSGGERMIVTLAALTATNAQLILCDEPTAGLSEAITEQIAQVLLTLKQKGTTVLLLEHNHDFALKIADSIAVLEFKALQSKTLKARFLEPYQ
jgi:ABC-type branched-subunit amino acid transport system ATPase component